MSQTTTPSGTQLLNILQTMANTASLARWRDRTTEDSLTLLKADEYERVAVASVSYLIARNAELEAERDALAAERDKQQDTSREWAQRASALAAENKALREALEHIQGLHSHDKAVFQLAAHCYDAKTIAGEALARTPAKENDDG